MCPYGNQLQLFHCFSLQEVSLKRSRCLTLEFAMNKDVNSIIAVVSSQAFYSLHLPLFFYSFVALALIWYHKSTRLEATHSVPRITNVSRHAQLHCRWASALLNLFIIAFLFMEFLTIIEPEMNHECSLVNTVCTNVFFFLIVSYEAEKWNVFISLNLLRLWFIMRKKWGIPWKITFSMHRSEKT